MRLKALLGSFLLIFPLIASASLLDRDSTESITVDETPISASATALPSANYTTTPPITYTFCVVESGSIRYSASGTNPSAADDGILVTAGQSVEIVGQDDLANIRFVRASATTAAYITCDYRR